MGVSGLCPGTTTGKTPAGWQSGAGASNGCWRMYWRIGPRYRDRPRADNGPDLQQLAASGQPPGGRLRRRHRGWMVRACPRTELGWLAHTRYLQPADDLPAGPSGAFYVRRRHRRHGVLGALIEAAIAAAALAGAPAVESYPVDTAMPAHSRNLFPAWHPPSPGTVSTSWPGASQPPGGTPQLTPPRPAPDPGHCRPMWRRADMCAAGGGRPYRGRERGGLRRVVGGGMRCCPGWMVAGIFAAAAPGA